MKAMTIRVVVCLLAVSTIVGSGSLGAAEDHDTLPAAWIVYHYVGRVTQDVTKGTGTVVGYFSYIEGVPGPLFSGRPSEATAYFTFRADITSVHAALPANGDVVPSLINPGNFSVYYSTSPNHDWSNPDSFSSGHVVATFTRSEAMSFQIGPVFKESHSAKLASSQDFTFNGQTLNFKQLTRHGVTDTALGSTTPLPESAFPVFTFSFGGYGVAIGSKLSVLGSSAQ